MVAPAKARRNSSRRVIWAIETRVLVTEVPMLAPMMIGIAPSMVSAPAATSPTVIEVVVDELCTRLVARMPTRSPTNGFAVRAISSSANPFPKSLNDRPIRSRPRKKANSRATSESGPSHARARERGGGGAGAAGADLGTEGSLASGSSADGVVVGRSDRTGPGGRAGGAEFTTHGHLPVTRRSRRGDGAVIRCAEHRPEGRPRGGSAEGR